MPTYRYFCCLAHSQKAKIISTFPMNHPCFFRSPPVLQQAVILSHCHLKQCAVGVTNEENDLFLPTCIINNTMPM